MKNYLYNPAPARPYTATMVSNRKNTTSMDIIQRKAKSIHKALNNGIQNGIAFKYETSFKRDTNGRRIVHATAITSRTIRLQSDLSRLRRASKEDWIHVSKHGSLFDLKDTIANDSSTAIRYSQIYGHLKPQGTRYGKFGRRIKPESESFE